MKKSSIGILIGLFLSTVLMAQSQSYQKDWDEGKLTWEDFSEKDSDHGVSELHYFLGYNTGKQKYGDTTVLRNEANCYMDKSRSWIDPAYKTEQYLRYNQVVFDIVEIHCRRLQVQLDKSHSLYEIEHKFSVTNTSCKNEIDKFKQESNGGQDLNTIVFWEKRITEELKLHPNKKIPDFENQKFGYGLHTGFGSGFLTGTLGEHFGPSFNFIFGFDLAYKKSIFYLNGTLAGDKVSKDYISDKSWYEGQRASIAIIDLSYGYALIDNENFKITPFAGLGITEFTSENKDDNENSLRNVDYNILFGINTDYKISTRLKLVPNPFFGVKEKVETSIRARLYITRAHYYDSLQGYSINLTIGLCGFGNVISLK